MEMDSGFFVIAQPKSQLFNTTSHSFSEDGLSLKSGLGVHSPQTVNGDIDSPQLW